LDGRLLVSNAWQECSTSSNAKMHQERLPLAKSMFGKQQKSHVINYAKSKCPLCEFRTAL